MSVNLNTGTPKYESIRFRFARDFSSHGIFDLNAYDLIGSNSNLRINPEVASNNMSALDEHTNVTLKLLSLLAY